MKKKENPIKKEGNNLKKRIQMIQILNPKTQMTLTKPIIPMIPILSQQEMQMVLFQITPMVKLTN